MSRRAIVCSYYPPQVDRDSGSKRMWDLIGMLLSDGWKVNFVASQGFSDPRYARLLQQRGVPVHDGCTTPLEEVLNIAAFDLALFGFWPIAEYYIPVVRRVSPTTRIVVDSLDLHFIRDARRIFREQSPGGGLLDLDYADQMRGEINAYSAADAVLAVSQKEADLVNDIIGEPGLARWVPDSETIELFSRRFQNRLGMVMVGSYQHPPNVEAVAHMCREILPRMPKSLLAQHPLSVVGHGLNETVRGFGEGLHHVRMVGWVPSIAPYFEQARISVVPLLHGAGTKRKMLQALMAGTPVVTTGIGAEGLNLKDREHAMIADGPEAFAKAAAELLQDENLWTHLRRKGRAHIAKSHGEIQARERFLSLISDIFGRSPKLPRLPEITSDQYRARVNYQYHQQLMPHIREMVAEVVPPDATVAVISEANSDLLKLNGQKAWHFFQNGSGEAARGHPADSTEALNRLEALRCKGAEFLLVPHPSSWWLNHYADFSKYLEARYKLVGRREEVCTIFSLTGSAETDSSRNQINELAVRSQDDRGSHSSLSFVIDESRDVRLIAFYLPQFHPIPENDAWWGEGFTEWRNVVRAQPLFSGHYQPQLPSDLGYYDLRSAETREAQADLARRHGIFGFCYYHYWFSGKRLLERPFNDVLASGKPDFPFCLCWANEPWSRQWDGRPHDVLQAQSYSAPDDLNHIRSLLPALSDPRAIKVAGRPVFLVYQGKELPNAQRTADLWRQEVDRAGLPGLYLIAVETGWDAGWDATQFGFDAKLLFQPQFSILRTASRTQIDGKPNLFVFDYHKAWPVLANPEPVSYRRYDTVFPAWDNTARKGDNGWVVYNSTPADYLEWLRVAITRAQAQPEGERIVFLNAWNEWAEGAHLEPDMQYGQAYLEATRSAFLAERTNEDLSRGGPHRRVSGKMSAPVGQSVVAG